MTASNQIVLIGGGGHALSCTEVIISHGQYSIAGFVDSHSAPMLSRFGYTYLGTDSKIPDLILDGFSMLVSIGQINSPEKRFRIFEKLTSLNAKLPSISASTAYIGLNVKLGKGVMIFHKAIVNRGASVGDNTIINTSAVIEHGVEVGNNCHIAPRALILGDAKISDNCFIGAGAKILPGVKINENAFIGAGVVVRRNVDADEIVK
jgi:sugar O-acyltransferase (sialic acid O-acetyltransferase NeuD family)